MRNLFQFIVGIPLNSGHIFAIINVLLGEKARVYH